MPLCMSLCTSVCVCMCVCVCSSGRGCVWTCSWSVHGYHEEKHWCLWRTTCPGLRLQDRHHRPPINHPHLSLPVSAQCFSCCLSTPLSCRVVSPIVFYSLVVDSILQLTLVLTARPVKFFYRLIPRVMSPLVPQCSAIVIFLLSINISLTHRIHGVKNVLLCFTITLSKMNQ